MAVQPGLCRKPRRPVFSEGGSYAAIHLGYKNEEKELMYPQFQNAMGTLLSDQTAPLEAA